MRLVGAMVVGSIVLCAGPGALAAEHPSLALARTLHNSADYDGAIAAAAVARSDPASADAAALVEARAYLERYRLRLDDADLSAARGNLSSVRLAALSPRDRIDLIVGIGQALYLGGTYDAAAELFDTALDRADLLGVADRVLLLDWWATSIDREAQTLDPDRRMAPLVRIRERMEAEIGRDPGNPVANYWLAAAARDAGDLDRAWHAAVVAWVRAILRPDTTAALRADLDRLVTEALLPDREQREPDAAATLRMQWDTLKTQWP